MHTPRGSRSPRRRNAAMVFAALLLATPEPAIAQEAEPGPPAPAYGVPGFANVDDRRLRRQLERSVELYVTAAMADFGTTQFALSRGAREANPLIPHRALVAPVKVVAVLGVLKAEEALRRRGHDGWAGFLRWTFVAINLAAAAWNIANTP